jgi:tRNA(fMet)-specific endonuclease VapC
MGRAPPTSTTRGDPPLRRGAINDEIAKLWGTLKAQAANAGHPLGAATQTNDLWVATTAIYHDAPLLTANRRHFENFPGLSLPA